ncbi:MAG: pyridoxal phosphate-dependent aminotransferase [Planctomycetes bacterium]|nr:pyridoxal phosphate-dependent aminotransferase [Planctomycetota bacterium]
MLNRIEYLSDWAVKFYHGPKFDLANSGVPMDFTALPGPADNPLLRENGYKILADAQKKVGELYEADAEQVTLCAGGSGAIFLSALTLGGSREVAVVESPVYEPLWRGFESCGTEVRFLRREWDDDYSLAPKIDEARKLAKGASAVMITNPNNPSGAWDTRETIARLAEAVHPATLVVNEAYLPFVRGAKSVFGTSDNVAIISTLTKAYGLSFLRFGWIAAPSRIAKNFADASIYTLGLYPPATAAAAIPFLDDLDSLYEKAAGHARGRPDALDEKFRAPGSRIRWHRPAGEGIVGLIKIEGIEDDKQFAIDLKNETGTVLAPGSFFREPGTMRIGLGARGELYSGGIAALIDFASQQ